MESSGEVDFANPEDETVKVLNTRNFYSILEHYNDFNQETDNQYEKSFLGLEKKLLISLNMSDFHIVKYLNGKEYFHYPKYGQIFRTNLFMFNIKGTGKELNNSYESFINFETNLDRTTLYDNYILRLRANSLRQKIDSEEPKVIIAMIPYKDYSKQMFEFFNNIYRNSFRDNSKDELHLESGNYITEFSSENPNIRLIHIPQEFRRNLTQNDFNKIAQHFKL